ncbi:MAG: ATP-binding protein [Candidatus Hydrogenedentales bacterium]|jgi:nitrogen-specific signal transduction histidine kinase/DNA-binding response OmpR family regulator
MKMVLIIADDMGLRASLRAALPETDLVLFEPSVDSALRRLISLQPDVLLLDDAVAASDTAPARLRENSPGTPLIVLSTRSDEETRAHFLLAGARECIPKPFSCDALRAALERCAPQEKRYGTSSAHAQEYTVPEVSHAAAIGQHQTALRWLSRLSGHIRDPQQLANSLSDALTDVFHAARCAVLLETEGEGVRVVASTGLPNGLADSLRFGFSGGLMRRFEQHVCLIDRLANGADDASTKELQVLGARLAAPLLVSGRVCGALVLGEKSSGMNYTLEERELLSALARSASASLENAELYHNIYRQQRRLDAVLGNLRTGVAVISPDRRVSLMNKATERILQVRGTEVLGRSVQKLGSGFADVILRTMKERRPHLRQEVHDPAIDATLGLSATPLDDGGAVVVFSRLPEEQASREDIAYSPFWEYLASRVAQEIKNPMVAINTFAQLLPKKYDTEDFRQAFSETVQQEIARINNVAETLFEFARHPRLSLKKASINDTVKGVLRSFEEELRARSIEVEASYDPSLPEVELDAVYFAQALHNVVQNSIDAMPGGGRLKVSTHTGTDACEVTIRDSGPGIPEQDAPLVFMPFFSTKEQGMGLGLTTANRIIRQHRGELKLLSCEEGGSVFALSVPSGQNGHADHPGD